MVAGDIMETKCYQLSGPITPQDAAQALLHEAQYEVTL